MLKLKKPNSNKLRSAMMMGALGLLVSNHVSAQADTTFRTKAFQSSLHPKDTFIAILKDKGASFQRMFEANVREQSNNVLTRIMDARKSPLMSLADKIKNPVHFTGGSVTSDAVIDTSYLFNASPYYRANYDVRGSWLVAGIPLNVQAQQQSWTDFSGQNRTTFAVTFDKDGYISQLKRQMAKSLDPAVLSEQVMNPLQESIANARQSLTSELAAINTKWKNVLAPEISRITQADNLFDIDIVTLKNKLLNPEFLAGVRQQQELLSSLQQRINNGLKVDQQIIQTAEQTVNKTKAIQELIQKIEEHKRKWDQSGLISRIKEFGQIKQQVVNNLLNNSSFISKMARQKLSLSGLQRLFLSVNRLDIGRHALNTQRLSFSHFLSNGISAELMNAKRSLQVLIAKQSEFNSINDYMFRDPMSANNGPVKSIGLKTGATGRFTTDISVSSFSQSMEEIFGSSNPATLRQVIVTTISNQAKIGETGVMSFELSRSATKYQPLAITNDSGSNSGDLSKIFATDRFMENTALSFRYADEWKDQGLSYQVNFNKTSNGYTNPGSTYLNAGSTELGTSIRKILFDKKLMVSFRSQLRTFRYNPVKDDRYNNLYAVIDIKWRFAKSQSFGLRYQPMRMVRKSDDQQSLVTAFSRLAFDANLYKKWGRFSYRNFISIGHQSNRYPINILQTADTRSLLITSFQQFMFGKKVFYANLNLNHVSDNTQYLFMSSSLYGETGYNFSIGKKINLSSGLVYQDFKNWYRQLGIRQTITGQFSEKLFLNLFLDARKNLKVIQPVWNSPLRGDISIRYILNDKN